MTIPTKIQFVSEEAKKLYNGELKYETKSSSGFDLRACGFDTSFDKLGAIHNIDKTWQEETPPPITGYTLFTGRRILIKTGIKVGLPQINSQNLEIWQSQINELNEKVNNFEKRSVLYRLLTPSPYFRTEMERTSLLYKIQCETSKPKYELQIRPRSGLALKHGISIVNTPGTVDSDYTGEIGIILINHGHEPFEIKLGDRIAQGVICPVVQGGFEYVDSLDETERGAGGFGSSGV